MGKHELFKNAYLERYTGAQTLDVNKGQEAASSSSSTSKLDNTEAQTPDVNKGQEAASSSSFTNKLENTDDYLSLAVDAKNGAGIYQGASNLNDEYSLLCLAYIKASKPEEKEKSLAALKDFHQNHNLLQTLKTRPAGRTLPGMPDHSAPSLLSHTRRRSFNYDDDPLRNKFAELYALRMRHYIEKNDFDSINETLPKMRILASDQGVADFFDELGRLVEQIREFRLAPTSEKREQVESLMGSLNFKYDNEDKIKVLKSQFGFNYDDVRKLMSGWMDSSLAASSAAASSSEPAENLESVIQSINRSRIEGDLIEPYRKYSRWVASSNHQNKASSAAASSSQNRGEDVLFVDIDGTLIHGHGANYRFNEALIEMLREQKRNNPHLKIYLFSSMNLKSLGRSDEFARMTLFKRLEREGIIDGIISTSDLSYKDNQGEQKAGLFYQNIYKPLMDAFHDETGNRKFNTVEGMKTVLQEEVLATGLIKDKKATDYIEEFLKGVDEKIKQYKELRSNQGREVSEDELFNEFISRFVNGLGKKLTNPEYGLKEGEDLIEAQTSEKGRMFQLYYDKNNSNIRTLAHIDDTPTTLGSVLKFAEERGIVPLLFSAKDFGTQQLKLGAQISADDRFQGLTKMEYSHVNELYSDWLKNAGPGDDFQPLYEQYIFQKECTNKLLEVSSKIVRKINSPNDLISRVGRLFSKSDAQHCREQIQEENAFIRNGSPEALLRLAEKMADPKQKVYQYPIDKNGVADLTDDKKLNSIPPDKVQAGYLAMAAWHLAVLNLPDDQQEGFRSRVEQFCHKHEINNIKDIGPRTDILTMQGGEMSESKYLIAGMNAAELNEIFKYQAAAKMASLQHEHNAEEGMQITAR